MIRKSKRIHEKSYRSWLQVGYKVNVTKINLFLHTEKHNRKLKLKTKPYNVHQLLKT